MGFAYFHKAWTLFQRHTVDSFSFDFAWSDVFFFFFFGVRCPKACPVLQQDAPEITGEVKVREGLCPDH